MWAYSRDVCEQHKNKDLIYWGANLNAKPRFKKFLNDAKKVVPRTIWPYADVGHNPSGNAGTTNNS